MRYLLLLGCAASALAPAAVDYHRDVAPILAEHCYRCHGAEKVKGKLRLDSLAAIAAGGRSGAVVVAGEPATSELLVRIRLPGDDEDRMPPEGESLPANQIAILEAWIVAGADLPATAADASLPDDWQLPPTVWDKRAADLEAVVPALIDDLRRRGFGVEFLDRRGALLLVDGGSAQPPVGDADLALLAPLIDRIGILDLGHSAVGDAGLAALSGATRLERLHLQHTAVGDAGLTQLPELPALRWLNGYGTRIGDAGARALLTQSPLLRHCFLHDSAVSSAVREEVEQALVERIARDP